MLEITDTPPFSIRRELDVIVLQEVRASSRPYIGLHVAQELQDKPRTLFFRSLQTRDRPSKALRNQVIVPLKGYFGQQWVRVLVFGRRFSENGVPPA